MDSVTTSPFPMTVASHGGYGYGYPTASLQNADALLVHSNLVANGQLAMHGCVAHNSKENAINTLEVKFQSERQTRSLEVQAERIERENQRMILAEHDKTRELIRQTAREQEINARLARIEAAIVVPK